MFRGQINHVVPHRNFPNINSGFFSKIILIPSGVFYFNFISRFLFIILLPLSVFFLSNLIMSKAFIVNQKINKTVWNKFRNFDPFCLHIFLASFNFNVFSILFDKFSLNLNKFCFKSFRTIIILFILYTRQVFFSLEI